MYVVCSAKSLFMYACTHTYMYYSNMHVVIAKTCVELLVKCRETDLAGSGFRQWPVDRPPLN